MSTTIDTTAFDRLREGFSGTLIEPDDPGYDEARTLFNVMIDRRPAVIARCAGVDDVIAAIGFARETGLPSAVRSGGHSVAGTSMCDRGIGIDVRPLKQIEIDPERRVARIGAGCTWGEFDRAAQVHGLATTGGRVSTTGVAGLTLGGGSGWLERKHGLACDNLLAVELVTADGRTVRASDDKHPELLWALRGGGGNFGVVTALEFRLHPLGPEVTAGLALYPAAEGAALLARWGDAMRSAPAEVGLAFAYLTAPEEPSLPAELHGQTVAAIAGLYAGPPDE
ncbi:MAG TPA: FAD-binding oxidoreductase, partial [Solirubrobacteraceae bacterium]|nr:FAD-binding oxidoreductase [Solirubrobacteraceae bacterium]